MSLSKTLRAIVNLYLPDSKSSGDEPTDGSLAFAEGTPFTMTPDLPAALTMSLSKEVDFQSPYQIWRLILCSPNTNIASSQLAQLANRSVLHKSGLESA